MIYFLLMKMLEGKHSQIIITLHFQQASTAVHKHTVAPIYFCFS